MIFGFVILAAGLICLAVWKFAPSYRDVVWLFIYSIPSHVYISVLPHEPVLIFYGKLHNLFWVVLAATVGTCIAGFIDYETLRPVFNYRKIKRLYYDKPLYRKSMNFFYKAPFWMIVIAALAPIPFYPFKFLSIASGYPEWKYLSALIVGRAPRYLYLSLAGKVFNIPNWILLVAFGMMLGWGLAQRLPEITKKVKARITKATPPR